MSNSRFIFFTFRAHVSETSLFEDFFALMKPFIKSHSKYAYAIERDNTLDRHLHILVTHPTYTEKKQFRQKLNANRFKQFKEYIKEGFQTNGYAFDTQLVGDTEEDIMTILGYIYKEETCIRRDNLGFSSDYILDSCKLYYTSEKIKHKMRSNDWKYVTSKNSHAMLEDFITNSEYEYKDLYKKRRQIMWNMRHKGISFQQIKDDTLKTTIQDLEIKHVDEEPCWDDDTFFDDPNYYNGTLNPNN